MYLAASQRRPSLRLHRDVRAVKQPMDYRIDPAIRQRQKHVKLSARLLGQRRPDAELEHLARRQRRLARPVVRHATRFYARSPSTTRNGKGSVDLTFRGAPVYRAEFAR